MKKTAFVTGACINTGVAIVKKFALEGWNVIFTGRNAEKTAQAESEYRSLFPNVKITGYALNSLTADGTVDEQSVTDLFDELDKKCVVIDCLVLNAADQGLRMKV